MRIVVTGGAGFIGSHVVDTFREDQHDVLVIDNFCTGPRSQVRDDVDCYEGDICSEETAVRLREYRPQAVVHMAAQVDVMRSIREPSYDYRQNVEGTQNMLRAAEAAGADVFVFASSGGAVYGDAEELPTTEGTEPKPLSPYGAHKLAAEQLVERAGRHSRMRTVSLRLSNVYGPRQGNGGEGGVIAVFAKAMLENRQPVIFGDGLQTRDFVFAPDVAMTTKLSVYRSDIRGLVHVSTGKETNLLELTDQLQKITSYRGTCRQENSRAGEVRRSCLSTQRMKALFPKQPTTPLLEGLQQTVDAFCRHHASPKSSGDGLRRAFST